jgi:hypothetical protein
MDSNYNSAYYNHYYRDVVINVPWTCYTTHVVPAKIKQWLTQDMITLCVSPPDMANIHVIYRKRAIDRDRHNIVIRHALSPHYLAWANIIIDDVRATVVYHGRTYQDAITGVMVQLSVINTMSRLGYHRDEYWQQYCIPPECR